MTDTAIQTDQTPEGLSKMISTLPLPRASDLMRWDEPADVDRLTTWLRSLTPFYNPNLPTQGLAKAAAQTAEALVAGGFTSAEIRFAMRRMWTDKTMSWTFKKNYPINPADFIPHIHELRRLQSALMFPAKIEVVQRLCSAFPDELHPADFDICNYDRQDNPLYQYKHFKALRQMALNSKRLKDIPEYQPIGELLTPYTKEAA